MRRKDLKNELHKGATGKVFQYARKNRGKQTHAEKLLWSELRGRRLRGFKFRRQHPLSIFIADFYCFEYQLVVEIDGEYHDEFEQREYDLNRTYELEELGITVVRFTNGEVESRMEWVLEEIGKHLIPSPSP